MRHKTLKLAIAALVAFLIGFLSSLRPAPVQAQHESNVQKVAGLNLKPRINANERK